MSQSIGQRARRYGRWLFTMGRHRSVTAGRGSALWGRARVDGPLTLARGAQVLHGLDCTGAVWIGAHSYVGPYAYIRPGVHIGNGVSIGAHVKLLSETHVIGPHGGRAGEIVTHPIRVGDGCWLGAGVTVLPGVTIGDGAVVGAGAVVTRDVAADTVVVGSPARVVRQLDGAPGHGLP